MLSIMSVSNKLECMDCMGVKPMSAMFAQDASSSPSINLAARIRECLFEERRDPAVDLSLSASLQIFHESVDDASSSEELLETEPAMLLLRATEDTAMLYAVKSSSKSALSS